MNDESPMPFGKYAGKKLMNVPGAYLLWLADQPEFAKKNPKLSEYVEKNRNLLEKEAEGK